MEAQRRRAGLTEPADLVEGSGALVERFGRWPSFHDAEVHALRLDTGELSGRPVPSLELDVHLFRMTSEVDDDGFSVLRDHTLVTLRFEAIVGLQLSHFMVQNSLWDLTVEEHVEEDPEDPHDTIDARLHVVLDANVGLSAEVYCDRAAVVSVTAYEPPREDRPPRPKLAADLLADGELVLYADERGIDEVVALLRETPDPGALLDLRSPGLAHLHVHVDEWRVRVSRSGPELRIVGARPHLAALADHLAAFAAEADLTDPDAHTHVDRAWSPRPAWLDNTSASLSVVSWTARPTV